MAISLPLKWSITNLTEFFQEIRNGNKLTEYYNLLNLLNQEKKEPELQIRTSVAQWSSNLNIVPKAYDALVVIKR